MVGIRLSGQEADEEGDKPGQKQPACNGFNSDQKASAAHRVPGVEIKVDKDTQAQVDEVQEPIGIVLFRR
jgi:hypothetical protein